MSTESMPNIKKEASSTRMRFLLWRRRRDLFAFSLNAKINVRFGQALTGIARPRCISLFKSFFRYKNKPHPIE